MMGGAAAADSGRRKKEAKDRERRREAVRKKRQARAQRAERAFDKLSGDGASLPESRVGDFLSEVVQVPREKLEAEAVELVVSTARGGGEGGATGELSKSALLGAVEKYGEYVRKSKDIDDIFDKFDANKDGVLSRSELKKALKAHEKKSKADRNVHGMQAKLFIDDSDIDFILEQSDADNSGAVSRSELLPAIAAWEELAATKIEKKKKGGCTIS